MRESFKFLWLICLFFLMSACAHIKIVSFDKTQNTVTVQGGSHASDEDYQKAADEYCKGSAALLNMNQSTVGTFNTGSIQNNGAYASAQATSVGVHRYNRMFKCKN